MPNMLALVACVEPHMGAWLRPQGREVGVRVYPELGPGEAVWIHYFANGDAIGLEVSSGFTPLPLATAIRFRAQKIGHGTPTNVEVVRNGKPSKSRDANDS